jgi:FAD/FMN-containing dehydrogenase
VGDVDAVAGQLTAGAGVTVAAVHDAARAAGWEYGVDLAARDSATIGGTVATNAGGLRVLRFGATSAQVVGIEAVLGDGSVVSHMGGLIKDNTGYHLPSLLCGSEGTLGVVTAVRVRLVPGYPMRVVALLGFPSVGAAVEACGTLRLGLPSLDACEMFLADGIELVERSLSLPSPISAAAAYLLVECADVVDPSDTLASVVAGLDTTDVAVAIDGPRQAELWRYREGHSEAINGLGPPHKFDVTLPAAALAPFIDDVRARIAALAPTAATWIFGHAADGNLHVNVTGLSPDDERVDDAVLTLTAAMGGSISAEHGIGTAKKQWLHLNRSTAELAAMRAIKRALDPDRILNPNALFA